MDERKTKQQLIGEVERLRQRVAELEAAEAAYRRTEQALRESEERYRIISELTSDDVFSEYVEPGARAGELVREWTTDGFTRVTGYAVDDIDPRGGWSTTVHPDDMPIHVHAH